MSIKQTLCKHKTYRIIKCEKGKTEYLCRCEKCGYQFKLPKAKDEMYEIYSLIKQ